MRILLTNDDGIDAPGLLAMARELKRLGQLTVCAPARPQSAVSHSLTLYHPLLFRTFRRDGVTWHAVEGTPADCVKLALVELLRQKPRIVVSGINKGLNTGSNVLYSGTVAGAFEGAQFGLPAFAVSLQDAPGADFARAARRVVGLIRMIVRRYSGKGPSFLTKRPGQGMVFNINIPAGRIRGVRAARQEPSPYKDRYERRVDPRGRAYYWLHGTLHPRASMNGDGALPTDTAAVLAGYISVTPLTRDMTCYPILDALRGLRLEV